MNRTHDLSLATFIIAEGHATLRGVEGQPGRRIFVFDREVPDELTLGFHTSREKKLLDVFRSLKASVLTG